MVNHFIKESSQAKGPVLGNTRDYQAVCCRMRGIHKSKFVHAPEFQFKIWSRILQKRYDLEPKDIEKSSFCNPKEYIGSSVGLCPASTFYSCASEVSWHVLLRSISENIVKGKECMGNTNTLDSIYPSQVKISITRSSEGRLKAKYLYSTRN
ncbi:unnamed protein product [Moneuplotes crassus]|uniref:Uncharacterized protein n=1 Tax=Euplotes crassus TaxID=5936 RepID=A0AAD1X7P3_EUPCR|nr:unnamed protein product [Moneuplotes crassus]